MGIFVFVVYFLITPHATESQRLPYITEEQEPLVETNKMKLISFFAHLLFFEQKSAFFEQTEIDFLFLLICCFFTCQGVVHAKVSSLRVRPRIGGKNFKRFKHSAFILRCLFCCYFAIGGAAQQMWNQSKLFYACKRIHYLAEKKETIKLL
jgi:hypothetical protein